MRGFCLPGQIRVFKDKSTSRKGYLPLAVAQEIQMKVLSFPANARIKGRKKRRNGFALKVRSLDLLPWVGAVHLGVSDFSSCA